MISRVSVFSRSLRSLMPITILSNVTGLTYHRQSTYRRFSCQVKSFEFLSPSFSDEASATKRLETEGYVGNRFARRYPSELLMDGQIIVKSSRANSGDIHAKTVCLGWNLV